MFRLVFLFISFSILFSCNQQNPELESLKKENLELTKKLMQAKVQLKTERRAIGELSHDVFLNIKDELDKNRVLQEVAALKQIKYIKEFRMGQYKELSDPRSMKAYEIKLQMTFANSQDYTAYQNDSIHLAVKENLKAFLESAPASYDFVIQ